MDLSRGAPAWGDAGVIVPWTMFRIYGDTRLVERHYDAMTRWMSYLLEANPNLLRQRKMGNNYGDWLSPRGDRTPKDLLGTAYWAYDARLLSEMATAIGRDDAQRYAELFERIKPPSTRPTSRWTGGYWATPRPDTRWRSTWTFYPRKRAPSRRSTW